MSSFPSHDGPSNQSAFFDYSRNETSNYGKYTNTGQHAGVIHNHQTNYHQTSYQSIRPSHGPLEELRKRCSPSAAFNSAARFDPPRCAEATRLQIIQVIEEWMKGEGDNASIFWLYGGAGAGKSAVAQSLSEKFHQKELAASFFFFGSDPTRNNGDHLIPTLVSQLARNLKGLVPLVEERISEDWDIFAKGYNIQIQELLVDPLRSLKSTEDLAFPPRLLVIDGLDECTNPNVQCLLLRAIAGALLRIPYPLRFLITSRPEAHITHVFNHDPALQTIPVQRYNLSDDPDADMDIRNFLEKEFGDIRKVHRLGKHLPHTWPDPQAISSLVERSSGHFIFASTVVRYIQSPKHRPDDRLEVILRLRSPQEGDKPYAPLDALYGLIFEGVESRVQIEKICLVLGILYFRSKRVGLFHTPCDSNMIEKLLGMKVGDLVLLLDPILSLVAIEDIEIRIYHKTLYDYLLDSDRGGHLPFDLCRVHGVAANYILSEKIAKAACIINDFRHFAFHCQYGYLSDASKDYLFSLEVPCPKFLKDFDIFPPWGDHRNEPLHRSIWHFLRALSREDFDPTGRAYEQYVMKWITYLEQSPLGPLRVSTADALKSWLRRKLRKKAQPEGSALISDMNDSKHKIDKLLTEWKPKIIHRWKAKGIAPVRTEYIKQELRIFSASFIASFPENANGIASSLVCGDDFIHMYSLNLRDDKRPMIARTYSKHRNAFFNPSRFISVSDTVIAMTNHLNVIEKMMTTDHYIKYGITDQIYR